MKLIDKEELTKDIEYEKCERCHYLGTSECYSCTIRDIVFGIGQYPTIDAVPVVHGCWEFWMENDNGNVYYCSSCNYVTYDQSNYCPHCGAEMDGDTGEK